MAVSDEYLQFVLEQLHGLGNVTPRRMFGGVGLYQDQRFFAIITRDTLYFKVNDDNRRDYEVRGMGRFRPYPNKPHLSMSYYEVPADVLEDADECAAWARRSVAAAAATKPAVRKPTVPKRAAPKRGVRKPAATKPAARNATAPRGRKRLR